jgi:hypothetical protein
MFLIVYEFISAIMAVPYRRVVIIIIIIIIIIIS